jgi:hypothetical protein
MHGSKNAGEEEQLGAPVRARISHHGLHYRLTVTISLFIPGSHNLMFLVSWACKGGVLSNPFDP